MKVKDLIFLFNKEIEKIKKEQSNIYIINAYNKVLNKIHKEYDENEQITIEKINNLKITNNMKSKLLTLLKTPLTPKQKEEQKTILLKLNLKNYLGIGEKKAQELINLGLSSIKQLKNKKWQAYLSEETKLMLKLKPLRKIPYKNIKDIEPKLTSFLGARIHIVGSYRRKKPFIKDIDILYLSKYPVSKYLSYLQNQFNNIWIYSYGSFKVSLILEVKKNLRYKLDIFIANKDNFYSLLLYTTGSKEFNIRTRAKAKYLNYVLNQNGIFDKKNNKINKPNDNEKKILSLLKIKYITPENR
jgi:DNA polymerase/3'-5' exonuclease PolX